MKRELTDTELMGVHGGGDPFSAFIGVLGGVLSGGWGGVVTAAWNGAELGSDAIGYLSGLNWGDSGGTGDHPDDPGHGAEGTGVEGGSQGLHSGIDNPANGGLITGFFDNPANGGLISSS